MKYHQLTFHERYMISKLRKRGYRPAEIARLLGRHITTITREIKRNKVSNGSYVAQEAQFKANGRRRRSRRNRQFTHYQWLIVVKRLRQHWSPEQIAGTLKLYGVLRISHETIYQYIWEDKACGGTLYKKWTPLIRQ